MNMEKNNTYYVTIVETLKKRVEVENAASEEDALEQVKLAYNKCDIILDENDFTDVKFKIKKVVENEEE
jgi:predicted RNA-binding protein with EMAP domain